MEGVFTVPLIGPSFGSNRCHLVQGFHRHSFRTPMTLYRPFYPTLQHRSAAFRRHLKKTSGPLGPFLSLTVIAMHYRRFHHYSSLSEYVVYIDFIRRTFATPSWRGTCLPSGVCFFLDMTRTGLGQRLTIDAWFGTAIGIPQYAFFSKKSS